MLRVRARPVADAVARTVAVLAGYVAACGAVVLIYQAGSGGPFTPGALAAGLVLAASMSLPGFVVLRLGLWGAGLSALAAFAAAGAVNSMLALTLFFWRPTADPYFLAMGLAAGAVYWGTERAIAGAVIARRRGQSGLEQSGLEQAGRDQAGPGRVGSE